MKVPHFKSHFIPSKSHSPYLMIVLHGRGDSLKPFRTFNSELKLQRMNYLLLNAPRKYLDGYSWYGEPPYSGRGIMRMRERLFQVLASLEGQGWKSQNIFLFGFSQGCLVSTDIALHYPKPFGGLIGVSGYFHFFPRWRQHIKDSKSTPWLMLHGTNDDILPISETRYGVGKLKKAGLSVQWIELNKDHSLIEKEYPLIRKWIEGKLRTIGDN